MARHAEVVQHSDFASDFADRNARVQLPRTGVVQEHGCLFGLDDRRRISSKHIECFGKIAGDGNVVGHLEQKLRQPGARPPRFLLNGAFFYYFHPTSPTSHGAQ